MASAMGGVQEMTVVWEWLNDGGRYQAYPPLVCTYVENCHKVGAQKIDLGLADPFMATYDIDFQTMNQVRRQSGRTRPIRRQLYPVNSAFGKGIRWDYETDVPNVWQAYCSAASILLEQAHEKNIPFVDLSPPPVSQPYHIDLRSFKQRRVSNNRSRSIRREFIKAAYPRIQAPSALAIPMQPGPNSSGQQVHVTAAMGAAPFQPPMNLTVNISRSNIGTVTMPVHAPPSRPGLVAGQFNPALNPASFNFGGTGTVQPPPPKAPRLIPHAHGAPPPAHGLPPALPGGSRGTNGVVMLGSMAMPPPPSHMQHNPNQGAMGALGQPQMGFGMPQLNNMNGNGLMPGLPQSALNPSVALQAAFAQQNRHMHRPMMIGRRRLNPQWAPGLIGNNANIGLSLPSTVAPPPVPLLGASAGPHTSIFSSMSSPLSGVAYTHNWRTGPLNLSQQQSNIIQVLGKFVTVIDAPPKDEECSICLDELSASDPSQGSSEDSTVLKLNKCSHMYHQICLETWYKSGSKNGSVQCPTCKTIYGEKHGNCPRGRMTYALLGQSVAGYENYGTVMITYFVDGGIQEDGHPNPGHRFSARGFPRVAYLPNCAKGKKVLELLIKAFERRLTFTIGNSVTTGECDTVVWNEIHHKTELTSNSTGHGYPDPNYLDNVLKELEAHGVTDDD